MKYNIHYVYCITIYLVCVKLSYTNDKLLY